LLSSTVLAAFSAADASHRLRWTYARLRNAATRIPPSSFAPSSSVPAAVAPAAPPPAVAPAAAAGAGGFACAPELAALRFSRRMQFWRHVRAYCSVRSTSDSAWATPRGGR
jgi:hypothetical protein